MISYHASHEQFSPRELLHYAQLAEQHGFQGCHTSDHFHPWSERQGQSGYSFSWLGAAMQATKFPYSIVTSPGQRYHPAIVAQAIATLLELFPDRLEVALGSGEALNEKITGEPWPEKKLRNERLKECAKIMKQLFEGESVTHFGMVKIQEAKLYTRPSNAPKFMCAALTKETAKWAGQWADGLLTLAQPFPQLKEIIDIFRDNGGEGKPVHLQVALSYACSPDVAMNGAYNQFRNHAISVDQLSDVYQVGQFDRLGESVTKEQLVQKVRISSNLSQHLDWLQKDLELGIDNLILHNVNLEQERFIEKFGAEVLPMLKVDNS